MIEEFQKLNSNFKVETFNFFDKKAIKKLKYPNELDEANISLLHEELKARQRLVRLVGGNEDLAEKLYEKGFYSACQIASTPEKQFIELTKKVFAGFESIKSELVYKNALARKVKATLTYTAIAQQAAAHYCASKFNNYQDLADNNFSSLPSYQKLFGDLDFCNCQDCRSVLSPAAYFVDLMRLEANYITYGSYIYTCDQEKSDLIITFSGSGVSGTIDQGKGIITLSGRILPNYVIEGTYINNNDAHTGTFTFNFSDEGARYKGEWSDNARGGGGAWDGEFISSDSNLPPINMFTASDLFHRRPDLWNLELSCDNTNTVIPKLEIVNKVLLNNSGLPKSTPDKSEDQCYQPLDNINYPFNLPFNLPLAKIRQYLKVTKTSLSDIWQSLTSGNNSDFINKAIQLDLLGLSVKQWVIYSTELSETKANDIVTLAGYYGLSTDKTALINTLQVVSTFLAQTGLDRNQLNTLLSGNLSSTELDSKLNDQFFINATGEGDAMYIAIMPSEEPEEKKQEEVIKNLTFARLDRLNRLIRLAQALNWSFIDADWAIRTVSVFVKNNGKDILLPHLSFIKKMQGVNNQLSVGQICAFIGVIKDFGKEGIKNNNLFDTIYNNSNVVNPPSWKDNKGVYGLLWTVPSIDAKSNDKKSDDDKKLQQQIQSALSSALNISLNDLAVIANSMLTAQNTSKILPLTLNNLSVLYRVSEFANMIALSIDEILVALGLPGNLNGGLKQLFGGEQATVDMYPVYDWLIAYAKDINNSTFSTYGLQYALTRNSDDIAIRNQILGKDAIQNFLTELHQDINTVLVTKDSFQNLLNGVLQQPQYSDDAVTNVYDSLVKDGKYIDVVGNVVQLPDQNTMEKMIFPIFPKASLFVKYNDPNAININVVNLSTSLIDLLSSSQKKIKLTRDHFITLSKNYFLLNMIWRDMGEQIFDDLLTSKFISDKGIVIKIVDVDNSTIKNAITTALFPNIPDQLLKKIVDLITGHLNSYYESQQSTLNKQLAGLFSIIADMFPTLIVWQGLSIGDLSVTQATNEIDGNNYYASVPLLNDLLVAAAKDATDDNKATAETRLKLLQQYVYLSKRLLLSPTEIDNIRYNPECYDVSYSEGKKGTIANQFTLQSIFLISKFKGLIQQFKDTQNRWVNYINWAKKASGKVLNIDTIAEQLSEITGWDNKAVVFLIEHLLFSKLDAPALWASMNGICQLQRWFTISQQLNLDIATLWQIQQLSISNDNENIYSDYSTVADTIWGGLTKSYKDNLKQLTQIKGLIEEQKRTALLGLVLNYLQVKEKKPVQTARDLYEYLLIDVEVSGIVETSYISEAISAVQLYLHRCRNHLEAGVNVQAELNDWWDWIESYRVWRANRQVFLYPENYIEPELRKHKTPLFSQLECDLQQLNLQDTSAVELAFQGYIDDFVEIANLDLIGSACRTQVSESIKEYCFIGRNKQAPHSYYYRTAIFSRDKTSNRDVPIEWKPWLKIDAHMQPIGPVQPTFAFGKWFIFWIEQNQTGSSVPSATKDAPAQQTASPQYSLTIKFSYLNLSGQWVATQTFGEPVLLAVGEEKKTLGNEYWNRVYPVYFEASQTLMIPCQVTAADEGAKVGDGYSNLANWNQGLLNKGSIAYTKYLGGDSRYSGSLMAQPVVTIAPITYRYWHNFNDNIVLIPIPVITPVIPVTSVIPVIPVTPVTPVTSDKVTFKQGFTWSSWLKLETNVATGTVAPIISLNDEVSSIFSFSLDANKCINLNYKNLNFKYTTQPLKQDITQWQQLTIKYLYGKKEEITAPNKTDTIYSSELFVYQSQYYIIWINGAEGTICLTDYFPSESGDASLGDTVSFQNKLADDFGLLGGSLITVRDNEEFYFSWKGSDNKLYIAKILPKDQSMSEPVELKLQISDSTSGALPDFAVFDSTIYAFWSDDKGIINLGVVHPESGIVKSLLASNQLIAGTNPAITASDSGLHLVWVDKKTILYSTYKIGDTKLVGIDLKQEITTPFPKVISLKLIKNQLYVAWTDYTKDGSKLRIATITDNKIDETQLIVLETQYKTYKLWVNICQVSGQILIFSGRSNFLLHTLGQAQIFINGQHFQAFTISTTTLDIKNLLVGCDNTASTNIKIWNGFMQESLFYNRPLSDTEIEMLYQNSNTQITEDLSISQVHDYSTMLKNSFLSFNKNPFNMLHVLGQPNSVIVSSNGIEFLNIFYNSDKHFLSSCYRLNTSAVAKLAETIFILGLDGLFTIDIQKSPEIPFNHLIPKPGYVPIETWPLDTIDFSLSSAMSQYYWEIFFHAPFLIANALQSGQQFAASKTWYEYIFNPVIDSKHFDLDEKDKILNDRYWRFIGLRSFNNRILAEELSESWADEMQSDLKKNAQLYQYHSDPFDPHAIAALRPIAYQKSIVMHYLNNILSWADNLFRQYTVESIMEATMLYVMAYDLLGKQPSNLGDCSLPPDQTLNDILKDVKTQGLQNLPEFLIILEQIQKHVSAITVTDNPNNYIINSYFGLPDNEQFISYWDKVKQALYNIRHGLNIDGVRQQLPLFESVLNPMDLVQQIGSGGNLGSVLSNLQTQIPYYRFEIIIQRAKALTQVVVQFGQSLLSALEKKDSEQLFLLNHINQQNILSLTQDLKKSEQYVAENTLLSLSASLQNAEDRLVHYSTLIAGGLSSNEIAQINLDIAAISLQTVAQPLKAIAIGGYSAPTIFGLADGGFNPGSALNQGASVLEGSASILNTASGLAATQAGYARRNEDWQLQKSIAADDKEQINYQIQAAKYQQEIAKQDFMILKTNIKQEQNIQLFLTSKFSNEQLYQWMIGKLSSLYFRAYQLAYNLALQAEQAWRFEKGVDTNFIKQNYWSNLNHGLITGEVLQLDLERMESAYMEQNQRRLEIQKTISLKTLDSVAFGNLKSKGVCIFDITEKDFDLDYLGHYCRQIKTVSLSFPVLIGPYQNICATLTQIANKTLIKPDNKGIDYLYGGANSAADNLPLRVNLMANQQIALSQGLNDTGLFVLNFNDERYLPFEGTGAISTWKLEMPVKNDNDPNGIDLGNLSDLIIQINYTALPGNNVFASYVKSKIKTPTA